MNESQPRENIESKENSDGIPTIWLAIFISWAFLRCIETEPVLLPLSTKRNKGKNLASFLYNSALSYRDSSSYSRQHNKTKILYLQQGEKYKNKNKKAQW
jgi:hypothetical protein